MKHSGIWVLFSVLCFSFLLTPSAWSAPSTAEYDLSEKCGKTAREWFKQEWGDGFATKDGNRMMAHYSNHYNRKLNVCLVLLHSGTLNGGANSVNSATSMLFDVNEQKDYGECMTIGNQDCTATCFVTTKRCDSYAEWQKLIEPFMTE